MSPDGLQASIEKMRAAGVGEAAIDTFAHYYEQLREGASGMLPESDIEPVADLPTLDGVYPAVAARWIERLTPRSGAGSRAAAARAPRSRGS